MVSACRRRPATGEIKRIFFRATREASIALIAESTVPPIGGESRRAAS
jgi:hypothetical protein